MDTSFCFYRIAYFTAKDNAESDSSERLFFVPFYATIMTDKEREESI